MHGNFIPRQFGNLAAEIFQSNSTHRIHYVMVHGLGFNKEMFRPICQLSHSVQNAASFDLPGHGASALSSPLKLLPNDDGSSWVQWSAMSAELASAVKHFKRENQDVELIGVGHSMGGALLVQASLTDATLFDSLVLVEPIILPPPFTHTLSECPPTSPAHAALKKRARFSSRSEAYDWYRARAAYAQWNDECLRLYLEKAFDDVSRGDGATMVQLAVAPATQSALYCGGQDTRLFETLSNPQCRFSIPTSLVCGSKSFYNATGLFSLVGELFANVIAKEMIPDTTHCCAFENVPAMSSIIDRVRARV